MKYIVCRSNPCRPNSPVATRGWVWWKLGFWIELGTVRCQVLSWPKLTGSHAHFPPNLTSLSPPHGNLCPPPPTSNPPSHSTRLPLLWKRKPERRKRGAPDSGNRSTLKLQTLSLRSKSHRNRASWDRRREERELRQGEREDRDRHKQRKVDIFWVLMIQRESLHYLLPLKHIPMTSFSTLVMTITEQLELNLCLYLGTVCQTSGLWIANN